MQVCTPAEKAWPRLIAASYLVVTGLIKDDEPSLSPSLSSLSFAPSLPPFGRKTDSLQSPIMGCFWKGEEIGKMMARGGAVGREGSKEGQRFSFQLSPLKRTAKIGCVLEGCRGTQVAARRPFQTSHRVKGPP